MFVTIWIRATKYVFENPGEDSDLDEELSGDSDLDGLCKSLKALKIRGPSKPASSKRKLLELLDDSNSSSEEEQVAAGSSKTKTCTVMKVT